MLIFTLLFCGIGLLILLIGGLMVSLAAFRQSTLWGLAYLFLPFANIVFVIRHWAKAKTGFATSIVGLVICLVPMLASGEMRESFTRDLQARIGHSIPKPPEPDLTAQIATQRSQIEELETRFNQTNAKLSQRYQALGASRRALKPGDSEAITRFNAEAAAYQTETAALREQQKIIADAHKNLDTLLAERSKKAAATAGTVSGKQVIMYTTAQCPACQQAKQYFVQRGVTYEERNVQQSRAAAEEFQRLGGRGVPLIMVGNQRMEGFSAQALDRML